MEYEENTDFESSEMLSEPESLDVFVPDAVRLLRKRHAFRADVLELPWAKEGTVDMGKDQYGRERKYGFYSAEQILKSLAPLLVKHRLEIVPKYEELNRYGSGPNVGFSVKLRLMFLDVDTGASLVAEAYGSGDDSAGKGLRIASTNALKQVLLADQFIADNVDIMEAQAGAYRVMNKEEEIEVRSKLQANAIQPKSAPKSEPEAVAPVEDVHTIEPTATEPEKTLVTPAGYEMSAVHKKAIDAIVNRFSEGVASGTITTDAYSEMSAECTAIDSAQAASTFIRKYRV